MDTSRFSCGFPEYGPNVASMGRHHHRKRPRKPARIDRATQFVEQAHAALRRQEQAMIDSFQARAAQQRQQRLTRSSDIGRNRAAQPVRSA